MVSVDLLIKGQTGLGIALTFPLIELSAGVYPTPECISEWYKGLPKRKDGQLDKRNPESKKFN